MKRGNRLWILLVLGMLIGLLLIVEVAPGWGMPDQNTVRQTVPELMPQAYLPFVSKNYLASVSLWRFGAAEVPHSLLDYTPTNIAGGKR